MIMSFLILFATNYHEFLVSTDFEEFSRGRS